MIGLSTLAVGCSTEPARLDPTQDTPRANPTEASEQPPASIDPRAGDPSDSPRAWADWPVEAVAPHTGFGWRLEPSGQFTRSLGLRLTASPPFYVLAIAGGTVRTTRDRDDGTLEIDVDHGDGIESRYLSVGTALVYRGMPVLRGTVLAVAKGPDLTLEIWRGTTPIDPLSVLRSPLQNLGSTR